MTKLFIVQAENPPSAIRHSPIRPSRYYMGLLDCDSAIARYRSGVGSYL